jgi:redox-sensitive bicupin YhaK (pirin superfamily)
VITLVGRARDLGGGAVVRRLLPAVEQRMVGPFIFADYIQPMVLEPGQGMDVRPHPHINLATVTYLFEGEILHRDSLGSEQPIRPGAVNWMMAGRGIVHSERSPAAERERGVRAHGMQLWVAVPTAHEEDEPSFQHCPADSIPVVEEPGVRLRVIAGSAYGVTAPARTVSPLFYVEAHLERGRELALPDYAGRAAYLLSGSVSVGDELHQEGEMLLFAPGENASLRADDHARLLLLGGDELDGERHIFWNFVSSSQERIERAKTAWRNREFPLVPGDETEFIPLP